jgi:outer membrane biosynthesis protein TonB
MSRSQPASDLVMDHRRHREPPEAWLAGVALSLLLHSLLLLGVRFLVARVVVADGGGGAPLEFIEVVPDPNGAAPAVNTPKAEGVPPPPSVPNSGDPVIVAKANAPGPLTPSPQPSQTQPAPQPSQTQPVPQPSQTQPAPQPSQTQPVPQPSQTQPVPQPRQTQPVPQPRQTQPVPQPSQTQPAPQPQPTTLAPAKTSDGKDPTDITKSGGGGGGNDGPVRSAGASLFKFQATSVGLGELQEGTDAPTFRFTTSTLNQLLPPTSPLPRGTSLMVQVVCILNNPAQTVTFQAKPQVDRVIPSSSRSATENAQIDQLVRGLLENALVEATLDSKRPNKSEPELSEWTIQLQITVN